MTSDRDGPYNVILVSFDTLRRDHLQAYGYNKSLSPALDKLARDGVVFEDPIANCGWTLPQHVSMLTGLYPTRHKIICLEWHGVRKSRMPIKLKTLAEIFKKAGYVTLGFCNQNGYGGGWQYGFHRGMDSFTTIFPFNNMMEKVVEHVNGYLQFLKDKPFFMYIHTNDTHEPFAASEPFGTKWGNSYRNKYEGEISYVDHYFNKILEKLEELEISDKTLVIVTSDHGTEFKEHGFLEKKLNLYEEIIQIPLIMKLPDLLPKGKRIKEQAETIDIFPTILDVCSLQLPKVVDGQSLLKRVQGERSGSKYVFSHTLHEIQEWAYEHWSVRNGRYKFIRMEHLKQPQPFKEDWNFTLNDRFKRLHKVAVKREKDWIELYDLKRDPTEKMNIAGDNLDIQNDLEKKLDDWIKSCNYKTWNSCYHKQNL
jgi:arylsulfatase A-like enzyme